MENNYNDNKDALEMPQRPKRRSFTAEYKARILDEYSAANSPEERGAIIRREGLYSSHIAEWKKVRENLGNSGLQPKKRKSQKSTEQKELEALRRRNEFLEKKVVVQKTALELAGKAQALLEMLSESAESNNDKSKK